MLGNDGMDYHSQSLIAYLIMRYILLGIGKDSSLDLTGDVGITHAVVVKLVEGLEGRGHHVYMDNFYTSPALFSDLHHLGFGACGTVRSDRRGLPAELKGKMKKGEVESFSLTDFMMALKWMDKRQVNMLSTIHDDSMVTELRRSRHAPGGREDIRKPSVIEEYNKYMGGVDKGDQLLSYYGFTHRTVKWWRRAFFHLLDVAIVNAYILYTISPHTGHRLNHEHFRIELAKELLADTAVGPSQLRTPGPHPRPLPPHARLTERHFPGRTDDTAAGRQSQPDCIVCSRKKGRGRKTTTFKCKQCDLPMCVTPCFELYHTKVDPERYI